MPTDTNLDRAIYAKLMGIPFPAWPIGAGNVFWVDSVNGDDGNSGLTPALAFASIIFALTQCVDDNNDYIFVIEDWDEAATITVTSSRVHIIGLSSYPQLNSNQPFVALTASGAYSIFTINEPAGHVEIAGFACGGGAAAAGIESAASGVQGPFIHDCAFGHFFSGGTPRDGIFFGVGATNIRVERCYFYGAPTGKGLLTRDGLRYTSAPNSYNGTIIDNKLLGLPGIGINITAAGGNGGFTIQDNVIECGDDVQGSAITLGVTVFGCLVVGNKAIYGPATAAMVNNPYLDNTVAAPWNAWVANYKGNALIDPA